MLERHVNGAAAPAVTTATVMDETTGTNGAQKPHTRPLDTTSSSARWLQLGHELRTPLNAILGNLELLLDGSAGPLSAQARACLYDMQTAGRQLTAQVKPLLLLLQATAGRAPVPDVAVDLLDAMRRALMRSAGEAAAWELVPGDARLLVRGNPFWLDALARTAVEVSEAGASAGRRLRVVVKQQEGSGDVHLRIATHRDSERLPAISLCLIDAVLEAHGGRAWVTDAHDLCLDWPAVRVVFR